MTEGTSSSGLGEGQQQQGSAGTRLIIGLDQHSWLIGSHCLYVVLQDSSQDSAHEDAPRRLTCPTAHPASEPGTEPMLPVRPALQLAAQVSPLPLPPLQPDALLQLLQLHPPLQQLAAKLLLFGCAGCAEVAPPVACWHALHSNGGGAGARVGGRPVQVAEAPWWPTARRHPQLGVPAPPQCTLQGEHLELLVLTGPGPPKVCI